MTSRSPTCVPRRLVLIDCDDSRVVADPIAIVSIGATSTVAIAVPFISARLERQRLRHQAHEAQLDELRALLDECAVHLTEALGLLYDLHLPDVAPERREAARAALAGKADQLLRDGVRLALRLGDKHEIRKAHQAAEGALLQIESQHRKAAEALGYEDVDAYGRMIGEFIEVCTTFVGIDSPRRVGPPDSGTSPPPA
jgi:hypothetical protein